MKDPQYQGEDWNNYDEILFTPLKYGNISDPLNYDATEKIGAGYGMVKYTYQKWEFIAGVRVEHTNQGYTLKFPTENTDPEGYQKYTDVLPSFHVKYGVHKMRICVSRMPVPSIVPASLRLFLTALSMKIIKKRKSGFEAYGSR